MLKTSALFICLAMALSCASEDKTMLASIDPPSFKIGLTKDNCKKEQAEVITYLSDIKLRQEAFKKKSGSYAKALSELGIKGIDSVGRKVTGPYVVVISAASETDFTVGASTIGNIGAKIMQMWVIKPNKESPILAIGKSCNK